MSRARDLADLGQDKTTLASYVDTGVTSTDLERIDITTEGTSENSKVVTADSSGHVTLAGELRGPATLVIDPATVGDESGLLHVKGGLQVDGTTTTINSETLTIDDKNIVLASGAVGGANADGAGITIDGASATMLYTHSTTSFDFNKPVNVTGDIAVDNLKFDGNTISSTDTNGPITIDTHGTGDINLTAGADVNIPANIGLTFGDDGEKIEGNGDHLTIASSGNLIINTGVYDLSNQTVDITLINTTDALNFDGNTLSIDAQNNRIGIGLNNPSSALHISAADVASSGTSNAQLHIRDTAAFSAAQNAGIAFEAEWQSGSFTQIAAINASRDSTSTGQYGGHLKFHIRTHGANVSEAMRISSAGNVGIGIDPSHLLHVQQTAATGMGMLVVRNKNSDNSDSPLAKIHNDNISDDQAALHVRQDSPGYAIHVECNTNTTNYGNGIAISTQDENTTSFPLYIGTNTTSVEAGNPRFVVRADGNVGIGTETPGGPLEIFKTGTTISSNAKFITRLAENNNPMRGISIGYLSDEQTGVIASATSAAASNLSFWVFSGSAWGERARINSAGNFNASNGDNAGSDYYDTANSGHVFHTNTDQRILSIENSHDSTPIGVNIDFSDADPNSNSLWYLICTDGSNNARCAIYSTGDVKNLNGTYTNFSDERLKTNISEASSQWDDIKTLNFKKYQLKQYGSDAPYHLGLIGQDVEKTSPHLVDETPANEYHIEKLGFKEGEMVKGLKQSILYMKGMVALQEAMARIETLETKVTALESA